MHRKIIAWSARRRPPWARALQPPRCSIALTPYIATNPSAYTAHASLRPGSAMATSSAPALSAAQHA
jgi:hypothetical protein